jgi:hypothetical protein
LLTAIKELVLRYASKGLKNWTLSFSHSKKVKATLTCFYDQIDVSQQLLNSTFVHQFDTFQSSRAQKFSINLNNLVFFNFIKYAQHFELSSLEHCFELGLTSLFDCCQQSLEQLLHPSTHPSIHPSILPTIHSGAYFGRSL